MTAPPSPQAIMGTPKRKREDPNNPLLFSTSPDKAKTSRSIFTFEPPTSNPVHTEDGNSSPRSKVAQKFKDLSIVGSGGGVGVDGTLPGNDDGNKSEEKKSPILKFSPDLPVPDRFEFDGLHMQDIEEDQNATRKRVKLPESEAADIEAKDADSSAAGNASNEQTGGIILPPTVDPMITETKRFTCETVKQKAGSLKGSYPSINRLSNSKSRRRRRAGTPPLASRRKAASSNTSSSNTSSKIEEEEEEPIIIDPVRAALTWHEDEITVYDPQDADDDGTGINGIGFKPTPAIAHARAQKRKQQLANYRKREENEARARRNAKRREAIGGSEPGPMKRRHSIVKVRFTDAEPTRVITT